MKQKWRIVGRRITKVSYATGDEEAPVKEKPGEQEKLNKELRKPYYTLPLHISCTIGLPYSQDASALDVGLGQIDSRLAFE